MYEVPIPQSNIDWDAYFFFIKERPPYTDKGFQIESSLVSTEASKWSVPQKIRNKSSCIMMSIRSINLLQVIENYEKTVEINCEELALNFWL